jgi:hypothetical protein
MVRYSHLAIYDHFVISKAHETVTVIRNNGVTGKTVTRHRHYRLYPYLQYISAMLMAIDYRLIPPFFREPERSHRYRCHHHVLVIKTARCTGNTK